ncbi:MAG TPA: TonB-dependent receptor [Pseudomonadales bacterium]
MKTKKLLLASGAATALTLISGAAVAQSEERALEEIVVTGSYIRGTPEDAALPVSVIRAEDLEKSGSPTTLELIKSLNVSQGVLGETNQFDARAQGTTGAGTVNLRGLGASRTLVLLNGRRMVANPFSGAADTNLLPMAAIGRLEVLKDGAAATYGSDAIGGVVNFITKENFEGLELGADYRWVDGSDGDYTAKLAWGWQQDAHSLLIAGGYQYRSELEVLERDWATPARSVSPEGGWSGAGNPAGFVTLSPTFQPTGVVLDPGCEPLGGEPVLGGALPLCQWQYTQFDNLIEKEKRYQLFADYRYAMTDNVEFFLEGLYAETDTPQWTTSPSYAALQSPTSPVPGRYYVPAYHPGLQDLLAQNPDLPSAAGGAVFIAPAFRPMALGGNPLYDFGGVESPTTFDAFRVSTGLNGTLDNGIAWDVSVTYMEEEGDRRGRDTVVQRFQRALLGFGGPNCTGSVPGANGCSFFNPFSNAVERNPITGATNPQFNEAVANTDLELIEWFFPELFTRTTTELLVVDAVLDGEMPVELAGGNIAWAAGAQYREDGYRVRTSDLTNLELNPCVDSVDGGTGTCTEPTGGLVFLGGTYENDLDRDVYAVFAELKFPITDQLEVNLAARYEDYGGRTGDTFDPKLSFRYQPIPELALRGSIGTTFRGPPVNIIQPGGRGTNLQNVLGTFRAVDTLQNPDLEPESADTANFGVIVNVGNFQGTLDYWRFDFDNPIGVEPVGDMVEALFPGGSATNNRCGDPALAGIEARFTFGEGGCAAGDVTRVERNWVNGPSELTSGLDLSLGYFWPGVFGGELSANLAATYVIEYEIDPLSIEGVRVSDARDAVGYLNYQTTAFPLPEWKGNLTLEWTRGMHNVRWVTNYIDSYDDQRFADVEVDEFVTHDLHYRIELPTDGVETTVFLSINNLTDEDPPFVRLELAYDPFTHDVRGRNVKVGVTTRF